MTSAAEIFAILRLARACEAEGVPTALARLVSVEGSHYRAPGARMLLAQDGRIAGAISAGCLEADLRERMPGVLSSGQTQVVEYDSRTFEDLVWGLGSGCNGLVRVLLSPFSGPLREAHERISRRLEAGESVRLATAVEPAPGSGLSAGEVVVLDASTPDPAEDRGSFCEEILPAISLLIAGAGPDAVPLARIAAGLGWSVAVASPRDRSFVEQRFRGVPVVCVGALESAGAIRVHPRSAAVVMSHSFRDDTAALAVLLPLGLPYLGVLGPRERTARLLRACGAREGAASELRSPAGLNIGAETAEEIALAIAAEIQEALGRPARAPRRSAP